MHTILEILWCYDQSIINRLSIHYCIPSPLSLSYSIDSTRSLPLPINRCHLNQLDSHSHQSTGIISRVLWSLEGVNSLLLLLTLLSLVDSLIFYPLPLRDSFPYWLTLIYSISSLYPLSQSVVDYSEFIVASRFLQMNFHILRYIIDWILCEMLCILQYHKVMMFRKNDVDHRTKKEQYVSCSHSVDISCGVVGLR